MCFLLFAINQHADYPLIVAANRDEYLHRPSEQAAFWSDNPLVLAGKDKKAGGTWLGVTRQGRFAALTNHRNPSGHDENRPSRGALVSDFLCNASRKPGAEYLNDLRTEDITHNGYNLVVGAGATLIHYSNQTEHMTLMSPGVHALSNALLDTPWPKSVRGTRELEEILERPNKPDIDAMLALLVDQRVADDNALPETGVGLDAERALSPIFIRHGDYGTRCSTIVTIRGDGEVTFMERTFGEGYHDYNDVSYRFPIVD